MFTADTNWGETQNNRDKEIKDILINFFIKTKPPFGIILSKYIFKYTKKKMSKANGKINSKSSSNASSFRVSILYIGACSMLHLLSN